MTRDYSFYHYSVALIIHLLIPLIGVYSYIKIINRIRSSKLEDQPLNSVFFLFLNYGGLLLILLTALFWKWSGMASLGFVYILVVGGISSIIIAFKMANKKHISELHNTIYKAAFAFPFVLAISLILGSLITYVLDSIK